MLLLSYCVGLVPLDPAHVLALRGFESVAFKRPVRIGDTIHVEGKLDSKKELDAAAGLAVFAWKIVNQRGEVVALAKVRVVWRRAAQSPERRRRRRAARRGLPVILEGKRLLVTGVVNRRSIAFSIAERAQEEGAEVLLTSFGRMMRMTERAAERLDPVPDVLELDVNDDAHLAALREELGAAAGASVDGAVHAIAFAPADALGGDFLATPRASAAQRLRDQRLLLQGAGRGGGAADERRRRHRRPRLRRHRRLAVL